MTDSVPPLLITAVLLLVAYLLGSVSGSVVLVRAWGLDPRQRGSGNPGSAHPSRTQAWRFGLGVALINVGKGLLATWLAQRWAPLGAPLSVTMHGYLAAGLAVIGHAWPLWHGLRGGKGAAPLVGGLLVLWPWSIPLLLLVWAGVLVTTGYVGLSTVLAVASLPLLAWWSDGGSNRLGFAIAMALIIAFTHRGNLQRLRDGTESQFARARLLYRLHGRDRH